MPYSLDYLQRCKTIRITEHGELKEETPNKRVYLKAEVIIEERIEGVWTVTEVYLAA